MCVTCDERHFWEWHHVGSPNEMTTQQGKINTIALNDHDNDIGYCGCDNDKNDHIEIDNDNSNDETSE